MFVDAGNFRRFNFYPDFNFNSHHQKLFFTFFISRFSHLSKIPTLYKFLQTFILSTTLNNIWFTLFFFFCLIFSHYSLFHYLYLFTLLIMFFSNFGKNLTSGSSSKSNAAQTTKTSSSAVKIKTVKVKKSISSSTPISDPLHSIRRSSSTPSISKTTSNGKYSSPSSRSGSSTPNRRTNTKFYQDDNLHKSSKPKPTRRKTRTPDLSRFNRASSEDDEYDDSNWEASLKGVVSSSASPNSAITQQNGDEIKTSNRIVYAGITNKVNVIHANSLMEFADYTPLFRGKKDFEYELAMPCTSFREK